VLLISQWTHATVSANVRAVWFSTFTWPSHRVTLKCFIIKCNWILLLSHLLIFLRMYSNVQRLVIRCVILCPHSRYPRVVQKPLLGCCTSCSLLDGRGPHARWSSAIKTSQLQTYLPRVCRSTIRRSYVSTINTAPKSPTGYAYGTRVYNRLRRPTPWRRKNKASWSFSTTTRSNLNRFVCTLVPSLYSFDNVNDAIGDSRFRPGCSI